MATRTLLFLVALVTFSSSVFAQSRDPASDRGGVARERPDFGGRDRYRSDPVDRPSAGQTFDTIALTNGCGSTIGVAITYWDGSQWIVRGWWQVSPGQTVTTDVRSTGRSVYFFASDRDGKEWNGSDRPDSLGVWITNDRFTAGLGDLANRPGSRRVSFFKKDTGETYGTYTQRFVCNR